MPVLCSNFDNSFGRSLSAQLNTIARARTTGKISLVIIVKSHFAYGTPRFVESDNLGEVFGTVQRKNPRPFKKTHPLSVETIKVS